MTMDEQGIKWMREKLPQMEAEIEQRGHVLGKLEAHRKHLETEQTEARRVVHGLISALHGLGHDTRGQDMTTDQVGARAGFPVAGDVTDPRNKAIYQEPE